MRNDTAVFIITHQRVNKQLTLKTLQKAKYSGDIFLVVDDMDSDLKKYKEKYGDIVLVFSKQEFWKDTDTYTNTKNMAACVYARNACIKFAQMLGYQYYFVCDDDIQRLNYRIPKNGKMQTKRVGKIEQLFEALINWLDRTEIKAIGVSENGTFLGGINQDVQAGVKYTMSKLMLYKTENPLKYRGIVFEDAVTVYEAYQRGEMMFSFMGVSQVTPANNTSAGGCAELYANSTSYVNYFYLVMCRPDTIKLTMRKQDFGIRKNRDSLYPKILNERWRKG